MTDENKPSSQCFPRDELLSARRVAFFNAPLIGTINPMLPIAAELVHQGLDVRWFMDASQIETRVGKAVKATGATVACFKDFFAEATELLKQEEHWLEEQGFPENYQNDMYPPGVAHHVALMKCFDILPTAVCLARRLVQEWGTSAGWRPDLVVYEVSCLYAFLAARKFGIPVASLTTWSGPGTQLHTSSIPESERSDWEVFVAANQCNAAANSIAIKEFGVDVLNEHLMARHYNKELNIVASIPELDLHVPEYQARLIDPGTFVWVGSIASQALHIDGAFSGYFCPTESVEAVEPESKASHDPVYLETPSHWALRGKSAKERSCKVILVSLGSTVTGNCWDMPGHNDGSNMQLITGRDFFRHIWKLLVRSVGGHIGLEVWIAIGPHKDALAGLELPSNFLPAQNIPQVEALLHADAFITHCGFNGITEALAAGVPMLGLPFAFDQTDNARALVRLDVGQSVLQPMKMTANELTEILFNLIEGERADTVKENCLRYQKQLLCAGGAKQAAKACMQHAASLCSAEQ